MWYRKEVEKNPKGMKINEIFNKYDHILVWGTGRYYQEYMSAIPKKVAYLVDCNGGKWGQRIDGLEICPPDQLLKEDIQTTLIVVATAKFDEVAMQISKYGAFDIVDLQNLFMIDEHEKDLVPYSEVNDLGCRVLICAGMHALWQRNGSSRFINGQLKILHQHCVNTIEIAPVAYYEGAGRTGSYIIVNINSVYAGIYCLEDFYHFGHFHFVIIHSLYYGYGIMDKILEYSKPDETLYYLHDYFALCSERFLFHNGISCLDEQNNLLCGDCDWKEKKEQNQRFHKKLFSKYNVVLVAPSNDIASRVGQIYQDVDITVLSHLKYGIEKANKHKRKRLRIAFLGVAVKIKGWDSYCKLVGKYYENYDFYCLGDCEESLKVDHVQYIRVEVDSDRYPSMVQALKKYDIDIAYIGSIVPESYSYTYYEAFQAGCYVVTTYKSGNVCAQVQKNHNGKVFLDIAGLEHWLGDSEIVYRAIEGASNKIVDVQDNDDFLKLLLWRKSQKNSILIGNSRFPKVYHNKISLIIYLYYDDSTEQYVEYLKRIPKEIDVYIFSSREYVLQQMRVACEQSQIAVRDFILKKNRGRDISTLLVAARDIVLESDIVGFFHDKGTNKEHLRKETQDWTQSMWENMLPPNNGLKEILSMFEDGGLGIVFPPDPFGRYITHWYDGHWMDNLKNVQLIAKDINIVFKVSEEWEPIGLGTFFWARTSSIRKLYSKKWLYEDFPDEPLAVDGTLNHAIEHLLGIIAMDSGYYCKTVMTQSNAESLLKNAKSCAMEFFKQLFACEPVFNLQQTIGLQERIIRLKRYAFDHKRLFLYGAGNYGTKLFDFFEERGVEIEGFLVSNNNLTNTFVRGIKVYSLDKIELQENDGIIIAVSKETLSDVEFELGKRGIKDYIYGF